MGCSRFLKSTSSSKVVSAHERSQLVSQPFCKFYYCVQSELVVMPLCVEIMVLSRHRKSTWYLPQGSTSGLSQKELFAIRAAKVQGRGHRPLLCKRLPDRRAVAPAQSCPCVLAISDFKRYLDINIDFFFLFHIYLSLSPLHPSKQILTSRACDLGTRECRPHDFPLFRFSNPRTIVCYPQAVYAMRVSNSIPDSL